MNKPDVSITKATLLNLTAVKWKGHKLLQKELTKHSKYSLFSVILKLLQGIHLQYWGRGGGNKSKTNKQSLSPTKPVT